MAITKAQQVRQMLEEGGKTKKIKGQEHILAYITPGEAKTLENLGGQKTMTPEGIPAYPPPGKGAQGPGGSGGGTGGDQTGGGGGGGGGQEKDNLGISPGLSQAMYGTPKYAGLTPAQASQQNKKDQQEAQDKPTPPAPPPPKKDDIIIPKPKPTPPFIAPKPPGVLDIKGIRDLIEYQRLEEEDDPDDVATAKAIAEQNIFEKILGNIPSATGVLKNILPKNPFDKIIGEIKDDPALLEKVNKRLGPEFDLTDEDDLEKYKELRQQGVIGAYGRPMGGFKQGPGGEIIRERDNEVIPQATPTTTGSVTPEEEVDDRTELEKLLAARGDAFRFFADGGMADDDDPVGGIMDLESGRQMYFLGKLVKKATKTIKKIAKSPIGKAALLYGAGSLGASLLGKAKAGGGLGFLKSKLFGTALPKALGRDAFMGMAGKTGTKGLLAKLGLTKGFGSMMPTALGGIGLASLAAGLMTPKEQEEEEQEPYLGPSIDIPAIRRDPYGAMGGAYSFYAEGGKAEPVAKKTMPLIDMDGMEKDYRETGGFVEMGRMERADDVPARLSKNEFVFTADAVRNAGDGSVDKGAEVMYNMMKNLEAGGEVSEESQGLEGARKMFQTSQRLGEVI